MSEDGARPPGRRAARPRLTLMRSGPCQNVGGLPRLVAAPRQSTRARRCKLWVLTLRSSPVPYPTSSALPRARRHAPIDGYAADRATGTGGDSGPDLRSLT
jgi:hypothetical protein